MMLRDQAERYQRNDHEIWPNETALEQCLRSCQDKLDEKRMEGRIRNSDMFQEICC